MVVVTTPGSQMMMAPNSPSEVTSEWTPHSADVDEEGTQPFGDPCPKIKQNVIFQVSKTYMIQMNCLIDGSIDMSYDTTVTVGWCEPGYAPIARICRPCQDRMYSNKRRFSWKLLKLKLFDDGHDTYRKQSTMYSWCISDVWFVSLK